jgi:hypothetical protein
MANYHKIPLSLFYILLIVVSFCENNFAQEQLEAETASTLLPTGRKSATAVYDGEDTVFIFAG